MDGTNATQNNADSAALGVEHDVLVWGPAREGERTASGRTVAKGWVWTCSCGAWDHGYPSEDAADEVADECDHCDFGQQSDAEVAARLEQFRGK